MYRHAEKTYLMRNKETHLNILLRQVDIDLTHFCNQDRFYCNSAEHRLAAPIKKYYTKYVQLLGKLSTWREEHTPKSFSSLHYRIGWRNRQIVMTEIDIVRRIKGW
jgi:hypothetical protein